MQGSVRSTEDLQNARQEPHQSTSRPLSDRLGPVFLHASPLEYGHMVRQKTKGMLKVDEIASLEMKTCIAQSWHRMTALFVAKVGLLLVIRVLSNNDTESCNSCTKTRLNFVLRANVLTSNLRSYFVGNLDGSGEPLRLQRAGLTSRISFRSGDADLN
ncbi:hypothetical protein BJX99DRAFT_83566 [Aspergillus californicus]